MNSVGFCERRRGVAIWPRKERPKSETSVAPAPGKRAYVEYDVWWRCGMDVL
ncbi:hypothetical protein BDZ89DRAFT_1056693 [Hymenopellis radicata]|nr:hypothetical protein BDZ89DRAFT_1056693 [Hymenopellis radicata]